MLVKIIEILNNYVDNISLYLIILLIKFSLLLDAPENVTVTSTNPQGVKEGQSATLTCYADGFPLPSFSWKFNGNPVNGAQQKTLVLTNARVDNAGNYTCVARNFRGSKEFTREVHVRCK